MEDIPWEVLIIPAMDDPKYGQTELRHKSANHSSDELTLDSDGSLLYLVNIIAQDSRKQQTGPIGPSRINSTVF